ncbi:hypothetical protein [Mycoplasma elephantis]|uniref:hypothetical protein n=1 Tax=Mycoplasma elephantis TaxID=114882 RepID=UPI000485F929|nr:hypothetical protein [Mycoplasma elephantis]
MKRKLKFYIIGTIIASLSCVFTLSCEQRGAFKQNNNNVYEWKNSNIKKLYKESADNANYTIHFMQHGGYPISHQINSIIYLDKESNNKNKQIMFWANNFIDQPNKYENIKGYNQKALAKYYKFINFDNVLSSTSKNQIYIVKEDSIPKYEQYKKIANFMKNNPDKVDFSLTFLEWYKFLLEPQHADIFYDILLNARKIIIISDGTAQSSLFTEAFDKFKNDLNKIKSNFEITNKYEEYKRNRNNYGINLTKFKNECPSQWIYMDKMVNNTPFISLINYDVSYLDNQHFKLNNLKPPYNSFQPVFLGKYGTWNNEAKPIIEECIKYQDGVELFSKKSSNFDPNKKTAIFMGGFIF